ncbi:hypothetical protein GIB67_013153 [Kingdonia uniflora]|uniref:Uncharacterized protein n=1 Tax=Kingdonia uniflora TaxID=39325 RepID=A0A7J7LCZ4_9MAGN|nr:hypothetical protein GIB67_013153 [Kingdonia uniflora]
MKDSKSYVEKNGMFFIETSAKTADNTNKLFEGRRCAPPPPESLSGNSCILKDMFGTNVAYGTVQFNIIAPERFYSVIIDEVIRKSRVCMLRVVYLVMSLRVKS